MKHTSTFKTKALWLLAICLGIITTSNAQSVAQILADIATLNSTAASTPSTGSSQFANSFPVIGNKIVFRASDGTTSGNTWMHGPEVFVLDVSKPVTTNGGTSSVPWSLTTNPQIIDLFPSPTGARQSSNPQEFVAVGHKVYFQAALTTGAPRVFGTELFELDLDQSISDSAGTGKYTTSTNPKVIDLVAGSTNSLPTNFYAYGSKLYFQATSASNGTEFWVYDVNTGVSSNNGSTSFDASTNPKLINIGSDASGVFGGVGIASSGATAPIGIGGKVYFQAASSISAGYELWVYDTAAALSSSNPKIVYDVNNTTITGTATAIKKGSNPQYLTNLNGVLVYRCMGGDTSGSLNQPIAGNSNWQLWKYDPTQDASSTNPSLIKQINTIPQTTGSPFGGSGVFAPSGTGLNLPTRFQQTNNVIYFVGYNQVSSGNGTGWELWRSDGTTSGTYMVKDLTVSASQSTNVAPKDIYAYNGYVYFNAYYNPLATGTPYMTSFVYDASQDTTQSRTLDSTTNPRVLQILTSAVSSSSSATRFTGYNGKVYFSFADPVNGTTQIGIYDPSKTYKSAGAGSSLFAYKYNKNTNPRYDTLASPTAGNNSNPSYFTDVNGTLVFQATGVTGGAELYKMNIYDSITASAGTHGSISSSGLSLVNNGDSKTYTITPDCGYAIDSLIVDGVKVTTATTKTFTAVSTAHSVRATFIALPAPTISISGPSSTLCNSNAATYTASITNGGTSPTYQWVQNGANVGTPSGSNSNTLPTTPGNYTVSCIVSNNDCPTHTTATSTPITVTLLASPTIGTSTGGGSMCNIGTNNTRNVYNSYTLGGGVWSSSDNSIATVATISGSSGVVTAHAAGTATITYTKTASNGCAVTAGTTVTVGSVATPDPISGTNVICKGSTTTLTGPTGGTWSSQNAYASVTNSGADVIVTGLSAGTAVIAYTIGSGSCSASTSYNVTINAIPNVPSISYATGTVNPQYGVGGSYCAGKVFTLNGTPSGGSWSFAGAGVANVDAVTGQVTLASSGGGVSFPAAASVTYTRTVNGCNNGKTITGTVTVCSHRGDAGSNEQLVNSNEFAMYPNPAHSSISLNVKTLVGAGSIVVTDLYGKQVKAQTLSLGGNIVDVSNLSKGFYFVSIITSEGKTTKKLIVE